MLKKCQKLRLLNQFLVLFKKSVKVCVDPALLLVFKNGLKKCSNLKNDRGEKGRGEWAVEDQLGFGL